MNSYIKNGKLIKADRLPQGLYLHKPGDKRPTLVDPDYHGFKIVYAREQSSGRHHGVITDTMDGTWNPIDGKMYDSKSKYYQTVKDAGCEIAGNDPAVSRAPQPKELSSIERKQDIARAMYGH